MEEVVKRCCQCHGVAFLGCRRREAGDLISSPRDLVVDLFSFEPAVDRLDRDAPRRQEVGSCLRPLFRLGLLGPRRFGRLPWKDLFDSAIELAEGHVVSKVLAERLPENRDGLAADPGCAALYLPQGRPVEIGAVLRQPALAASKSH